MDLGYLVDDAVITEVWNTEEEMIFGAMAISLTNCIENGKGT